MISLFIPIKNEARDLPACLKSVAWSDDVHVYDSGSTDESVKIAQKVGAKVTAAPQGRETEIFGGDESRHKKWALDNIRFRNDWVLHIDADERVTPELASNALKAIGEPGNNVAFRVRRRDFLAGQWLEHTVASSYYIRLFRPEKMTYQRIINPVSVPLGPVGEINGFLDHHPFSKGITHWVAKHNSYASLEARQIARNREAQRRFSVLEALVARDPNVRRFHQKELFYRLPFRPLMKFLILYAAKRGFLDGRAGFQYAALQSIYEYMIVLKTRELREERNMPDLAAARSGIPRDIPLEGAHANSSSND